jgi:serine O-acetyltransferase
MNKQANWGIEGLVKELRDIRVHSLETRDRLDKPPRLPDRKTLAQILEGLSGALFPNRLGRPDLREEGIDYFVGNTLDNALRDLHQQIYRELHFMAEQQGIKQTTEKDAQTITREFAAQLPRIRLHGFLIKN